MKKTIFSLFLFFLCLPIFTQIVWAEQRDTLRVGLHYSGSGSNGALLSANLENYENTGKGYYFGYYDDARDFVPLGTTSETQISMSQDINLTINSDGNYSAGASSDGVGCYHLQLNKTYASYDLASAAAAGLLGTYGTAFPAYDNGRFVVRMGNYTSQSEAEDGLSRTGADASVTSGTSYTVTVTKTGTNQILFEYDDSGNTYLAVEPRPVGSAKPQTWFKGYRYYGGFEYDRSSVLSGGKINVINVVDLEDYTKCVITFEMSPSWPAEALKAQSVCARTYALNQTKHKSRNFDVCSTTNCQVYRGASACQNASDAAVDATAGLAMYYDGKIIEADYYSSNGGASEDSENVWTTALPYLRGKKDPYESTISIPGYSYEKSYSAAELTKLLQSKGHSIGTVASVQASYTRMGNIYSIKFTDTSGKCVTVQKESCRLLFSVPSMRFTIHSGSGSAVSAEPGTSGGGTYYINGEGSAVSSLESLYTISGSGTVSKCSGDPVYVRTADGISALGGGENGNSDMTVSGSTFVIKGTGNGHNVGMSQYGAYAMAKQGLTYRDILTFYYTGITIE